MKEKEIIQERIDALSQKNFKFDAWKTATLILLERIFGPDSRKISMIEKLDYEYNSWSLRDSKGSASSLDTCREQAKAILEAALLELDGLGSPAKQKASAVGSKVIKEALEENLRVKDYKRLLEIIKSEETKEVKQNHLASFFHEMSAEVPVEILSSAFLNPSFEIE